MFDAVMAFAQGCKLGTKFLQYFNNQRLSGGASIKSVSFLVFFCMFIFLICVPSQQGDSTVLLLDYGSEVSTIILMT